MTVPGSTLAYPVHRPWAGASLWLTARPIKCLGYERVNHESHDSMLPKFGLNFPDINLQYRYVKWLLRITISMLVWS